MNRAYSAFLLTSAVALAGCASTQDYGTPAVHELARLQSMGQLDQARLACVITALPAVVDAVSAQLKESRSARAVMLGFAAGDHARSVQQSMGASDASGAASRAAIEQRRVADSRRARGDYDGAAIAASHAMDLQSYALEQGEITILGPVVDELWTDDEAELLVEYANLRFVRAAPGNQDREVLERIATIEGEHPKVVNGYATFMIQLYRDPALPCAEGL